MKFLCLGYFEPAKMDALPQAEIQAIMGECMAVLPDFLGSGQVLLDAGLDLAARRLRRVDGAVQIEEGRVIEDRRMIGSVSIIEAADIDEAVSVASRHPSARVDAGEQLGWTLEVRAIHSFQQPGSTALLIAPPLGELSGGSAA
jgi:hypothetical protein